MFQQRILTVFEELSSHCVFDIEVDVDPSDKELCLLSQLDTELLDTIVVVGFLYNEVDVLY